MSRLSSTWRRDVTLLLQNNRTTRTCTAKQLPLEGETPGDDGDIWRQAHRQQHFGAEDARVAHLDPLLQTWQPQYSIHSTAAAAAPVRTTD